jgi:hypothetical protein
MTPANFDDALEKAIRMTGVSRYRYLCLEHPRVSVREQYRRLVCEIAGVAPPAQYPSLLRQAANLAGAVGRVMAAAVQGEPIRVSPEVGFR